MKLHTAYLLLGSNIGDSQLHLQHALEKIKSTAGEVVKVSSNYETQPWGVKNQDDYLNSALQLKTRLSAEDLFEKLKDIEVEEGRISPAKNAPRTLDIDIIFFDDLLFNSDQLTIPHPRMHLRRFVLQPLCEIAPNVFHPLLKKTVSQLLSECYDDKEVKKLPTVK